MAASVPGNLTRALRACAVLLDAGFWRDGGINYYPRWQERSETCISAMILSLLCWFGFDDSRVDQLARHVMDRQMPDGGWNCRAMPGYGSATHGSFHTTISALEALVDYERGHQAGARSAREAQARGRETGTTTCCGASTIFAIVALAATRGSRMPSSSSRGAARATGAGLCSSVFRARLSLSWRLPAGRAAGTPCERCVCCAGGKRGEASARSCSISSITA
jgi:hypothetical protein